MKVAYTLPQPGFVAIVLTNWARFPLCLGEQRLYGKPAKATGGENPVPPGSSLNEFPPLLGQVGQSEPLTTGLERKTLGSFDPALRTVFYQELEGCLLGS